MRHLKLIRLGAMVAAATLALGLLAGPATAKSKSSGTVTVKQFKALQKTVTKAVKSITGLTTSVGKLQTGLNALNSTFATFQTTATTVIGQFTQLANAVKDTTTGLPGLNAARPLVGAVVVSSGTSTVATGSEFTIVSHTAGSGNYVIQFTRAGSTVDVSARSVIVQPFPTGAAPLVSSTVNCSVATNPCGAGDTAKTDELVVLQNSTTAAPSDGNGFQVAAIAG